MDSVYSSTFFGPVSALGVKSYLCLLGATAACSMLISLHAVRTKFHCKTRSVRGHAKCRAGLSFFAKSRKQIKSSSYSLYYAKVCNKFVRPYSAAIRLRHCPFAEMSQRWRAVGNAVSNLTGPRFKPQASRFIRNERVTARPTARLLFYCSLRNG